jgi:transcriptional regulator with XRE-family HTH domain
MGAIAMLDWRKIVDRMIVLYEVQSQKALAEKLGVSQTLVSQWRNPSPDNARAPSWKTLAKAVADTGTSWDRLLTGETVQVDSGDKNSRLLAGEACNRELIDLFETHRKLVEELGKLQIAAVRGSVSQGDYGRVLLAATRGAKEAAKKLRSAQESAISGE